MCATRCRQLTCDQEVWEEGCEDAEGSQRMRSGQDPPVRAATSAGIGIGDIDEKDATTAEMSIGYLCTQPAALLR